MDLTQLAHLGEFVGGVAVLVTLIYLVVQVRQNTRQIRHATEVAQGTAELETAKMNMSYFENLLNPETSAAWEKAYTSPEDMIGQERAHFVNLMAIWFHLAQGHHRQYRRGLLPEASWAPIARTLAGAMRQEAIRRRWSNNVSYLANDFRAYVERLSGEYPDEVWVPERLSEI